MGHLSGDPGEFEHAPPLSDLDDEDAVAGDEFDVVTGPGAKRITDRLWHGDLALSSQPGTLSLTLHEVSDHVVYITFRQGNAQPRTEPEDKVKPPARTIAPMTPDDAPTAPAPARVARLSYFFPAHNEEANLQGLVEEALETLPSLAETFEIIAVDDGSKDATPDLADALAAKYPDVVRAVHHPTNLGYGAALRSGFAAARYDLVAFTDGDRQFKVADIATLTARLAEPDAPDVVVGFRIKRADPLIRTLYARAYRLANRIFFGLKVTDVDCACKLLRREALEGLRVESGGAFFSAEMIIKLRGRRQDRGRGRCPPLPPHGRLGHRRQAPGRLPRHPRLLAPAPAHVGQPQARPPPRRADGRPRRVSPIRRIE